MALPQNFLDELIYRSDIVDTVSRYVQLRKTGSNHVGLCPFHNEKTPSFTVSRDKQFFKCFGCGEGGNVITFVMKMENLPFIDAVRLLAERCGMTVPEDDYDSDRNRRRRERMLALNRDAARYFHDVLMSEQGKEALEYLRRRGLSVRTVNNFGLGYAPDSWDTAVLAMRELGYTNAELEESRLAGRGKSGGLYSFFRDRVMFPIIDLRGSVLAFGGRVMRGDGGGRKYINSPDTLVYNKSRNLYGINLAKKSKASRFLLCEGNMDVIALHQAGFDSAVASCGTAFTAEQAKLLSRYTGEVVICFDADAAGRAATQKAIDVLAPTGMKVRVLRLPPKRDASGQILLDASGAPAKTDPDEFIKENGAEAFASLLEKLQTDGEYRLAEIRGRYDLERDDGRIAYLKDAAAFIAGLASDVEREIFARTAASEAGVSAEAMLAQVSRERRARSKKNRREEERRAMNPLRGIGAARGSLRYENPASAKCEEMLLAAALADAEILRFAAERISPEEFSSPFLAKIYESAIERQRTGAELSPGALMSELTEEEAGSLAAVVGKGFSAADARRAAEDYISKIKFEHQKREKSDDILLMAAERKRDKED